MTKLIKVNHNGELKLARFETLDPIEAEMVEAGAGRIMSDADGRGRTLEYGSANLTDPNPTPTSVI